MNKDKEQFYKDFYSALEKTMEPSGGHLIEMDIPKNNHTMQGITIKFDNISAAPTIYPDFYYPDWKDGQSMNDIVSKIRSELIKTAPELSRFSINSLNQDSAVNHLQAAVVGYENNKEWLKNIPHERMEDLAVFAKWQFDTAVPGSVVSAKITEPLLAQLKLTKEEALKMAKANTVKGAVFQSMNDTITEIYMTEGMDREIAEEMAKEYNPAPLHVLRNESGIDGAALIACPDVLKAIGKEIGEEFYVLPSSVHEALILPKSFADDVEDLKEIVSSINENEVEPEDRLSDNVYEFDGHSLKLAGAIELKQERGLTEAVTHHRGR